MILRTVLAATALAAAVPAFAQTDPATSPPAAAGAPKPYVAPSGDPAPAESADEAAPAPPSAPPITNIPPADPASQQAVEALPTQVEDVQIVGPWTQGDASGVWRTVMLQVGASDKDVYRFFLQKLDRVGPGAKVVSTTEVKEVAGVNGTVVGYRAEEGEDGGTSGDLTLFFDVVPPDGEVPETYELHFMQDNTYTFGPASN